LLPICRLLNSEHWQSQEWLSRFRATYVLISTVLLVTMKIVSWFCMLSIFSNLFHVLVSQPFASNNWVFSKLPVDVQWSLMHVFGSHFIYFLVLQHLAKSCSYPIRIRLFVEYLMVYRVFFFSTQQISYFPNTIKKHSAKKNLAIWAFVECQRHSAKPRCPVVIYVRFKFIFLVWEALIVHLT